ncbi:cyclin N-terminal domain-containing protein 1-like [Prorops nasuta]|uniref:cyclin N-terminal domain-containing protein 1-like n=1 Tax=Prorops nasuta TaxID=863751 RepID=UPI0034CFD90C
MDLDSAYLDTLIDDWTKYFQDLSKDYDERHDKENLFQLPFLGVPSTIVKAIFKITKYLQLGIHTKYLTVHLYDNFMCNYFWEVYKATGGPSDSSWSQICKKISHQSKLYLMSCLQLASKMDSHSKCIGIPEVIEVLRSLDNKREYTRSTIFSSEFKVFKVVGYRMPFYTPLSCIEVLLVGVGLNQIPNIYEIAMNLLDMVYLQHEQLYSHLQLLVHGSTAKTIVEKRKHIALRKNVLLLSASIILCATFFSSLDESVSENVANKLENLVSVNSNEILNMANIVLLIALQD